VILAGRESKFTCTPEGSNIYDNQASLQALPFSGRTMQFDGGGAASRGAIEKRPNQEADLSLNPIPADR